MKKNLIIVGVILGIIALGAGMFFAWKNAPKDTMSDLDNLNPQQIQVANYDNLPAKNSKIKILSKNSVLDYLSSASGTIFYIGEDGKIFKWDGVEEIVSDVAIENVQKIIPSPTGSGVIIKSGNSSDSRFDIFDFEKNAWLTPLVFTSAADWSSDGKKIAYLEENLKTGKFDLITQDLSDSKMKKTTVISLDQVDFDLRWISTDKILLISKPSSELNSETWALNLKDKTLSKILSGKGMMVNWSVFGETGLKFGLNGDANEFTLINSNGEKQANFKFLTFPDKCNLTSPSQLICAIPKDQEIFFKNSNILDIYLRRGVFFEDGIYQINLSENKFQVLFDGGRGFDLKNPKIIGDKLLFINRYDKKLYSFDL